MQCVISLCAFLPEAYPIIFKAVVQMAVENPFCRLQVLGCAEIMCRGDDSCHGDEHNK